MKTSKLTPTRRERFVKALAATGNVTAAVALAGTSRTRVYARRMADPAFAAAWDDAEESAADELEAEARRRAVEGIEQPIISMGKLATDADGNVVMVKRYSDALLVLLLKAHRPDKFRERGSVEISGPGEKPIQVDDARQRLRDKIDKIAERLAGGKAREPSSG